MQGFWIKYTLDGSTKAGYCQGFDERDAARITEKLTGGKFVSAQPLPYPAQPIIWQFDHPVHGMCPPFCYSPESCAGRTACPKSYACSE